MQTNDWRDLAVRVPDTARLTREQADLLHRATDAAQNYGACAYRTFGNKPCCVIAQADALSGGESWKITPNTTIDNILATRPELFATLHDYPIQILRALQCLWDSPAYEASEDEIRLAMHNLIDMWTVGR